VATSLRLKPLPLVDPSWPADLCYVGAADAAAVLHTSASLTINENASPDVPLDLNDALDRIVPEGSHYRHLDEGLDDMPAHVKSSLMGPSLTIPISRGALALGTWQVSCMAQQLEVSCGNQERLPCPQ
jgi:secondary thiamine-phosphate synthase enzyme